MPNKIEELYIIQEELAEHFSKKYAQLITQEQIFNALSVRLSDCKELEWAGDLWDISLEYSEALRILDDFDFNNLAYKIETSYGLLPENLLLQSKVRVKSKGQIWMIHRYDADPFPSNPHAHNIENNIKLDLSTGDCYKVREFVCTIKEKDLLAIRAEAKKVSKGELPALTKKYQTK